MSVRSRPRPHVGATSGWGDPTPAAPRRTRLPVLSALAGLALVVLAYVVAVGTTTGLRVDDAGVPDKATGGAFRAVLEAAMRVLNPATALLAAAAILALAGRRGRAATLVTAAVMAGSVSTAIALESAVAAVDPFGAETQRDLGKGFFPSGHSAAVMALSVAVILVTSGRRRLGSAVAASIAAALLGIGNLITQSHHPSDVVAGYLIAAAWGAAGVAIVAADHRRTSPVVPRTALGPLAAGLTVPAVMVIGFTLERPSMEAVPAAFLPAAMGLAVAAAGIVAGLLALVGSTDPW